MGMIGMKFYRNLYVGESIKNPGLIKWKLRTGRGQIGTYVISLCEYEDQLECFHNSLLKQKFFPKKNLRIVGITGSYEEALTMIAAITQEIVEKTGNADIKKYFMERF